MKEKKVRILSGMDIYPSHLHLNSMGSSGSVRGRGRPFQPILGSPAIFSLFVFLDMPSSCACCFPFHSTACLHVSVTDPVVSDGVMFTIFFQLL
jgi:hypothetical protein